MVRVLALSALALVASVSARVIPRHSAPASWVTAIMEDYATYHTRYTALDCQDKHGTAFFDACCHPMKANETLATARAAECNPANLSASASATASAPAATESGSDDDCDDEDDGSGDDSDEDCDDEPTSVVTSTAVIASATPVASSVVAKPETTSVPVPTTSEVPATTSAPVATTSETPETTVTPTTTKVKTTVVPTTTKVKTTAVKTAAAAVTTSASSSSSSSLITGGKATFFDQGGAAGSCGNVNPDSALIVAVQEQRMNSSLCGKKVLITNTDNGKTVTATVADTCPSCQGNPNSLDLSHGAFDAIADESLGVIPIEWLFLD